MKRRLLMTLALLTGAFYAHSQVTINESTHPITITGTDSLQGAKTANIAWPDSGANKMWDYGSIADTAFVSTSTYNKASNSNFSSASRYIQQLTYLNNLVITKNEYDANSSSGYSITGSEFPSRIAYSISAITSGNNDSLIFPVQHQVYSTPMSILPYPATYHSSWSSNTRVDDHFSVTIAAFGMNNTPGEHVTHVVFNTKVVGWGKMRVPFHTGSSTAASAYYDVLMVQRQEMDIDSFYLGGSPASATLLTPFGLKNGDTTTYNNVLFYRPYTGIPVAEFSTAPDGTHYAYYDRNNTALTGIEANAQNIAENVSLYPNPVSSSSVTLSFNKVNAAPMKLTITNALGQIIQVQNINKPEGMVQMQIVLPATLGNGMYFYSLSGQDGATTNGKVLLNR